MKWFSKNKENPIDTKVTTSLSSRKNLEQVFLSWMRYGDEQERKILTPFNAIKIYEHVAPIGTCIDLIADEAKGIELVLETYVNGEEKYIEDAPIMKLLEEPNADQGEEEFLQDLYQYYLITGEAFILATGDITKEPLELIVISPSCIDMKLSKDGFVQWYKMNLQDNGNIMFYRDDRTYRFYNNDKTLELWPIKGFNPKKTGRGFSKLNQVYDEIDQYVKSNRHNISLLDNGMRPSTAITTKDNTILTDEQFTRLQQQIENNYAGSKNAGRPLLLEGMDVKEMMLTNKDMDFGRLTDIAEKAVAKRFKIPLPLITSDAMTYSNFESAQLALYDKAVIPLVNTMCKELTKFLGVRFKLKDTDYITYDDEDITALQTRRFEELKTRKEIGVETPDEMRALLGREPLVSGGNYLYYPAGVVPIGSDAYTTDNSPKEEETVMDDSQTATPMDDNTVKSRSEFVSIMKKQVDILGNRVLTDEQIEKLADDEGF